MNGQTPAGSPSPASRAADAVLVVDSGGHRYAFELACVVEIRSSHGAAAAVTDSRVRPILRRNGVRIPILGLGTTCSASSLDDAQAVIVLDLPDRIAAVAVDAVCEVRIAHTRSFVPVPERAEALARAVAWVAVWDGGEAPVLDVAAWLRACEAQPQPAAQAAS
jgi:chemotaxis signal transduction protein